ncbi:Alpha galactosidase A-like protein 1 [Elsinoe fawcettii]|nr:Alpha galactosidase A-like protein 1 [Elsinoe fawcettii]
MLPAFLSIALLASSTLAINNGFGRTPVMGFNTYNDIGCNPNEKYMFDTMDSFAQRGFLGAGYKYFQIDCGWQSTSNRRQANGSLDWDRTAFPNGIRALADRAISRGFQWSMYTDQGVYACDTRSPLPAGSLGYERQDALQFAGWNVDYVKVDNCYITADQNAPKDPRTDFPSRFGAMSNALFGVGIKGVLVCQWGTPYTNSSYGLQGPSAWTPPLANSYRMSDDIARGWAHVRRIFNQAIHINLAGLNGPGNFADMDLLEVGNPDMTFAEQQTHFAIWAMSKSALMVSTPVPAMSSQTQSILQNSGLIAINQDPLGAPVKLVQRFTNDNDCYAGPLSNGDVAVLLFDQSNAARNLYVVFADLGITSADVTDLWTGVVQRGVAQYGTNVAARGSLALRLSNVVRARTPITTTAFYAASSGALTGAANVQDCVGCSAGKKVGNIDASSSLTVSGIRAPTASLDVLFDYINCDIGYLAGNAPNVRGASISVNGGAPVTVEFPLTGYEWTRDLIKGYKVRLFGFNAGSDQNIIRITAATGVSGYAPDFDRIGIVG